MKVLDKILHFALFKKENSMTTFTQLFYTHLLKLILKHHLFLFLIFILFINGPKYCFRIRTKFKEIVHSFHLLAIISLCTFVPNNNVCLCVTFKMLLDRFSVPLGAFTKQSISSQKEVLFIYNTSVLRFHNQVKNILTLSPLWFAPNV